MLTRPAICKVPRYLLERRTASFDELGHGEIHEWYWCAIYRLAVQPYLLYEVVSELSHHEGPSVLMRHHRFELLLRMKANYLWPGEICLLLESCFPAMLNLVNISHLEQAS